LRRTASTEIAAAYTWLAFACGSSELRNLSRDEVLAPATAFAGTPLLQYRTATCRAVESATLDKLIASEPRFREIDFARGQALVARRKLDDADAAFERAHQWHPAWPTLTLATANVAMTAEEFERALTMYDETLRYEPQAVDALLGKVRVLTFLARHQQAIDTVDLLLAERWYVGDGRYWRALNEMDLDRNDEAWTDVELAAKLLVNADVPKLAGLIAYRRQQLELSRTRFDLARTRNPNDCESAYYLGIVLGDLRDWTRVAAVMPEAARCLQSAEEHALEEIETIRASDAPEARKARQIAKREQSIATGRRWMVTSWFNTAVASYNLSRADDARAYAEKVVDDEQFGERARELLSRLR